MNSNMLIILVALFCVTNIASFCVHDEDCHSSECCVRHVCKECNVLRVTRNAEPYDSLLQKLNQTNSDANDNEKSLRVKRQGGCSGCMGLCLCAGSTCVCVPIQ